jgi:DNA-binding response OmpR family regulator
MLRIVLATARLEAMQAFIAALTSKNEVNIECVVSGAEALDAVRTSAPHLVIIDSDLPDEESLDLVQKLVMVNAMVNTAVVSPLSDAEFHEASEGLGILAKLSDLPGSQEGEELLHRLKEVI